MISAFNPTSKEAHIYAEFERVKSNLLERALGRHGALGIKIESFSFRDYLIGSGNALSYVRTKATDPGFYLIEKGSPSAAPAPATSINSIISAGPDPMPLEAVKALEKSVNNAEERAQMLEERAHMLEEELKSTDIEKEIMVCKFFSSILFYTINTRIFAIRPGRSKSSKRGTPPSPRPSKVCVGVFCSCKRTGTDVRPPTVRRICRVRLPKRWPKRMRRLQPKKRSMLV